MKKVNCPRCKKVVDWNENPFRPFCGEACKNYDLGKWANEEYRVPVEEPDSGVEPQEKKDKKES